MSSLRDPIPDDRKPSWKGRSVEERWRSKPPEHSSWATGDSSTEASRILTSKNVITALLIAVIASGGTGIFVGFFERRYRASTQDEVTAIVARAEAERDAWKQKYEDAQKISERERNQLEATISSIRRAREVAEKKAEALVEENATLRAKLRPTPSK